MRASLKQVVVLAIAVLGIASRLHAGIITVPLGLNPGDPYRLAFVTEGSTLATSTDIADYNKFVTDAANAVPALAALNATWYVIGSTATTNAVTNVTSAAGAVYSLSGLEVCNSVGCLFAGGYLYNPLATTELGTAESGWAWTGSNAAGGAFTYLSYSFPLGSTTRIEAGAFTYMGTNTNWLMGNTTGTNGEGPLQLYAISSTLTVPLSGTPEPVTIVLSALGVGILYLARRATR